MENKKGWVYKTFVCEHKFETTKWGGDGMHDWSNTGWWPEEKTCKHCEKIIFLSKGDRYNDNRDLLYAFIGVSIFAFILYLILHFTPMSG